MLNFVTSHGKIHLKMWLKFCYWVVKSKEAILDAKCLYTLPIYNLGLLLRYYVTVTFILVTPRYRHKTRGSYHSILRWLGSVTDVTDTRRPGARTLSGHKVDHLRLSKMNQGHDITLAWQDLACFTNNITNNYTLGWANSTIWLV